MQLHYSMFLHEGFIHFGIFSQEDLRKSSLTNLGIGNLFVFSSNRPEIVSGGIYLRGLSTSSDDIVVRRSASRCRDVSILRNLLETAILVKDQRTKRMYKMVNVCN